MIKKALEASSIRNSYCSTDSFLFHLRCLDPSPLHLVKSKLVYDLVTFGPTILNHLNIIWSLSLSNFEWKKILSQLWAKPMEPKFFYFLWRMFLHKLPFAKLGGEPNSYAANP